MNETVERPAEIVAISLNSTVKAAVDKMIANKIGCLIVNDKNGLYAGIVTERDIVNRVVASSKNLEKTTVAEIMTTRLVTCPVGTPTSKARKIMSANRIRHLPVVDNGVVIGILSARDLMGQQLLEDRAAAEEVAMLANCLKSIEISEAADTVTTEVPKLFQAKNCVLYLFDENPAGTNNYEKKEPAILSYNECLCPKEYLVRSVESGCSESIVSPNQSSIIENIELIDNLCKSKICDRIPEICEKLGAQSPRLIIPISIKTGSSNTGKQLSGCLCMCTLTPASTLNRELTSYKAKLTREILTSHLTNASLYQQARLTSLTDALTGIGSRKLLDDKLQDEYVRAKRYKHPLSIVIIDLDNFKTINDTFGHANGDEALKKLAECMKKEKRNPDIIGRYGGDEFVILMPETNSENACAFMERLRVKVQMLNFVKNLEITISCGIAESSPDSEDSSSELMRKADVALYEAKSAGRNCVKLWNKNMTKALRANDIETSKIKKLRKRIVGLSEQTEKTFIQSIWKLIQTLESKHPYAKKHSINVTRYVVGISQTMNISPKQSEVIRRASMIHDIGKIGIPDAVLFKPERLTPRERNIIEQHPVIAVQILDKLSFLEKEIAIIRSHHEKWNGQGYPDGLSKKSIPFGARILAVADAFDALTSIRSYHHSRPVDNAIQILVDSSGYDFDPKVVQALVSWLEQICKQSGKKGPITLKDLFGLQKQHDDDCINENEPDMVLSGI